MIFDNSPTEEGGLNSESPSPSPQDLRAFLESEAGKELLSKYASHLENNSAVYGGGHSVIYTGRLLNSTERGIECIVRVGLRPIDDRMLERSRKHPASFVHVIDEVEVTAAESGWSNGTAFYIQFMVKLPHTLEQKIAEYHGPARVRAVAVAVAKTLKILHQGESSEPCFCHRDIKPANLLLDDAGHIFVADLDLAARITADQLLKEDSSIGTEGYKAPELKATNGTYSEATDIYALGVTLSRLITGDKEPGKAVESVRAMKIADYPDPGLILNVQKCLNVPPDKRPSAQEIIGDLASSQDRLMTRFAMKRFVATVAISLTVIAATVYWGLTLKQQLEAATQEIVRREEHLTSNIQSILPTLDLMTQNASIIESLCDYSPSTLLTDEVAESILNVALRNKQDTKYENAIQHLEWLEENSSEQQASIRARALHEIAAIAFYSGVPGKRIPNPGLSSQIESVFRESLRCWERTLNMQTKSASAEELGKKFGERFPTFQNAKDVTKRLLLQNAIPLHKEILDVEPNQKDAIAWNGLAKTWGYLGDLYRNGTSGERHTALALYAISASLRQSLATMQMPITDGLPKEIAELSNTIEVCRSLENFVVWSWLDIGGKMEESQARELYDSYFEIIQKLKSSIPKHADPEDQAVTLVLDRAYADYSHMFLEACLLVPQVKDECLDLKFHEESISKISSPAQRECLELQRAMMRLLGIYPRDSRLDDASEEKHPSLSEIQDLLAKQGLLHLDEGVIKWGSSSAIETWTLCECQSKNGNISESAFYAKVKPMIASTIYERIVKIVALRSDFVNSSSR